MRARRRRFLVRIRVINARGRRVYDGRDVWMICARDASIDDLRLRVEFDYKSAVTDGRRRNSSVSYFMYPKNLFCIILTAYA